MEVEDEWDRDPSVEDTRDLLFVTYNPKKITIEGLLTLIKEKGFEAKVHQEPQESSTDVQRAKTN